MKGNIPQAMKWAKALDKLDKQNLVDIIINQNKKLIHYQRKLSKRWKTGCTLEYRVKICKDVILLFMHWWKTWVDLHDTKQKTIKELTLFDFWKFISKYDNDNT